MQCAQMALLHSLHLKLQAMMRSPMHVREEVVGGPGHRERLLLALRAIVHPDDALDHFEFKMAGLLGGPPEGSGLQLGDPRHLLARAHRLRRQRWLEQPLVSAWQSSIPSAFLTLEW